jgi:uncharacterized SAM-binding protein YcdF (DUF218 family)
MSLPVVVQGAPGAGKEPPLAVRTGPSLASRADAIVVLGAGRERGDPAWGAGSADGHGLERSAMPRDWPRPPVAGADQRRPALRHAAERGAVDGRSLHEDFAVEVLAEEASRTTWENAQLSGQSCSRWDQAVVVVTQAWHMPRSRWSFERRV